MKTDRNVITRTLPQILLAVILLAAGLYIACSPPASLMNWYNNDDGFFYFKAAQRIVAGQGVTFDGINPTNGFHPLWMLICVGVFALFRSDLIVPLRVVVLIFTALQIGSALLLFDLIRTRLGKWTGWAVTLGFFTSWIIFSNTFSGGLESALSCLMTIGLWRAAVHLRGRAADRRGMAVVGLWAGLAVLSRFDNIILVAFLAVWLFLDKRSDGRRLFADLIAALIVSVSAAVIRGGYDLYLMQRTVLAGAFLLAAGSVLGSALAGEYIAWAGISRRLPKVICLLLPWMGASLLLWAGMAALSMLGVVELFSKSILAVAAGLWLIFVVVTRLIFGWIGGTTGYAANPIRWLRDRLGQIGWYLLPVVVLLGAYLAWSQINFGTPMPVSGQIKQWWGTLGYTTYGSAIHTPRMLNEYLTAGDGPFGYLYNLPGLYSMHQMDANTASLVFWLIVAAAGLAVGWPARKQDARPDLCLLPLLTATVYRVAYFFIVGYVHMRSWYWTVESISVLAVLVCLLADALALSQGRKSLRLMLQGIVLLLAALQVITWLRILPGQYSYQASNQDYLLVARQVEAATAPGDIIGTPGGGSLSYFIHDRTIVNLDGLMNSKEYFDALRRFDTRPLMARMGIQYVFANQNSIMQNQPYSKIFPGCLEFQTQIFGKALFAYTCE